MYFLTTFVGIKMCDPEEKKQLRIRAPWRYRFKRQEEQGSRPQAKALALGKEGAIFPLRAERGYKCMKYI